MREAYGRTWLMAGLALAGAFAAAPPLFEQIPAAVSGIAWVHDNAMSEKRYLPESLGPGCAFLDYDNDGWMDIYLVNSGPSEFYTPAKPIRNALYRNNRNGTFTDVTERAGVARGTFGMGAAAGDFDNDGFPDLFVTAYGRAILYRNNGNGTFSDATDRAGVSSPGWTTSAAWFDYDADGRLDLFVCNFVDYSKNRSCGDNKLGRNYYCVPRLLEPRAGFLYHNDGGGKFTETGHGTGIGAAPGKGLGVVAADINNDRRLDLFVANDTVQNFLFVNRARDRWEDIGLSAEVAFSQNGEPRSGMGVDAADFDGDGWEDLFVSNIDREIFSLYRNKKSETFEDVAHLHGIARSTRMLSGWGLKFFDFDRDGELDLFLANGHPDDMVEQYSAGVAYREPLLLFHHREGRLNDVSAEAGPVFGGSFSGRGLAVGDYNNDGRQDVLVGVNGGPPLLLRNNAGSGNHWIGLKLRGMTANRDAIGARITWLAGGKTRTRRKHGGGSYLSSHDPREVLALGNAARAEWVEIEWPEPSKRVERFTGLAVDRYAEIVEGKGKPVSP